VSAGAPAAFRAWLSESPSAAYVLGGEGAGLAEMVAELWLSRLRGRGETAEIVRWSSADMERESPTAAWRTPSFFCRWRVFLLPEVGEIRKGALAETRSYLENPVPHSVLVVPCADRKAFKALSGMPGVRAAALREDQAIRSLAGYAVDRAADAGKKMPEEVAAFLARWIGGDFARMKTEMAKLLSFAGARPELGEEEVRRVCVASGSVDPFRLADDLISRNRNGCIEQFRRFAAAADASEYHALVGAIAWLVRRRIARHEGRTGGGRITTERAGRILCALSRMDRELKGGSGLTPEQVFEIRMLALL
jgi:DNA polymerase III delta subunit